MSQPEEGTAASLTFPSRHCCGYFYNLGSVSYTRGCEGPERVAAQGHTTSTEDGKASCQLLL